MKGNRLFSQLEAERKVLVFGHRGFSQDYPENTMISFSKAAENPLVDAVELDVHLCKTGEVVISHDFSLKRTAGIDREIEDLTLEELKGIDVGSFKGSEFRDARVPLLRELFSTFGTRFYYDIELKVKAWDINRELSRKVIALIDEFGLRERVFVSSFNPLALRVTSFGQSTDAAMLDTVMKRIGVQYAYNATATADAVKGYKTVVIAVGASTKGLGAAGISEAEETERAKAIMQVIEETGAEVICCHIGGSARRGTLSDLFADMVMAKASWIVLKEDANFDYKFTKFAEEHNVPISLIYATKDALTVFTEVFSK